MYLSHWNGPWCLTGLGIYKSWGLYSTETQWKEMGFQKTCGFECTFVWNIHLSLYLSLISQTNSNSHHFSVTSGLERVLLFHVTDLTDTSCCLYKLFNHNLWHWDNCALNAGYAAGTTNWAVSRPSFRWLSWQGDIISYTKEELGLYHSVHSRLAMDAV